MDVFRSLWFIAVTFTGLTSGTGLLPDDVQTKAVGGTVTFITSVSPSEKPPLTVAWDFTNNNGNVTNIITSVSNYTAPQYVGRITFFSSTGSLELRNLALTDSGQYQVTAVLTGPQITGQTRLNVLVPVSSVEVTVSRTDLVEFNSSVSLSCSSSGSSLSFLWLNRSTVVTATDRVQLTDGGRNLTIVSVSRYDQGPFNCNVSNAVSSGTSKAVNLSISFGPDDVNLKKLPPQENYVTGSNVNLSCSADSSPAAQFTWFLNRTQLPDTGPELTLTNIQTSQSGDYSCQAFNTKTLRYQTSQPSALIVQVPVSSITVTVSGTDLVEFNSSVSLSCSSSGSSLSFLWLNRSSVVTATDRVQLLNLNRTITIVNVSRYDQGPFSCGVSNAVSSGTSELVKLSISFGPDNINLKPPPEQKYVTGSNVDLSCSADSSPAAQFTWFLNRTQLPDTGPELTLTNIQTSQSGDYSCQAFNTKTLRYQMSLPSAVIVLEHQPSTGGCSGGCIAGIVIAVVVVVVVVVLLVYFLWLKPKQKKISSNRDAATRTGGEGQDNTTSPQNQELHYAHISFQNKNGGTVQMGQEDNPTQYAEINAYRPRGPSSPPTYDAHMDRMRGRAPQSGANGAHGAQVHRNLVLTSGGVEIQTSINPAVAGGTLTLSLSPPTALNIGSWAVGGSLIITWVGEQQASFANYSGRASVNIFTGALTLNPVIAADSGVYILQCSDPQLSANTSVTVLEPISNVTLTTNQTSLMEFSGSTLMTCSVSSGSCPSLLWLNGSSKVAASARAQFTNGNSTLQIVNVTRYDQGPYACYASNAVSNQSSNAVNLTILYGPDNMALTVNGQNPTSVLVGSNLTVLCSAQSSPPAHLQWLFKGQTLNSTGSMLNLYNVSENQSGPYSCVAFNNITFINTSITTQITINSSGAKELSANVWLLPLLLWGGLLLSLPGMLYNNQLLTIFFINTLTLECNYIQTYINLSFCLSFYRCLECSQTNPVIFTNVNPVSVGSNITLFSTRTVSQGAWLFNNDIIVFIASGASVITDKWISRVTYNSNSSSLTISSVTVSDSGVYTLNAINSFSAQLTLSVQVPISNVALESRATSLVEFNDTAVLTCSISNGSLPSYVWLNGSAEVTAAGNVRLSDANATLTIANVTRYDEGPFTCNVSNGVGSAVSPRVLLNISYGPSNAEMRTEPLALNHIYRTGSNITLTCSAESKPSARIMWMINDVPLNASVPQLQLQDVTRTNSANYKCLFYNSVTLRYSSASVRISVMDPLTAINLFPDKEPAIVDKSFSLYCNVTGPVESFQWWRNGQLISQSNTTIVSNNTLTFNPVLQSDNGLYECQATNAVSNVTSRPFAVKVNYGPEVPTIMGPNTALAGDNITLTCSASSYPPSTYAWFFNGSLVAHTSAYVTPPLTTNMTGIYTCVAHNNVTGLNSTAHKMVTVVAVRVKAPVQPAIAGHPYMLTCSVSGPAANVQWMMDGQHLSGDNATHVLANNTLYFQPVARNDTGRYQCVVVNAGENLTSHPYMLLVDFGPEPPLVEGPAVAKVGQSAIFNCSAASEPPSQISWWFNDTLLANDSVLVIEQLSLNMSGYYTCMAFNNVTGLSSTSRVMLTVTGNLTVVIKTNMVPVNSSNFSLICDVAGPFDWIYWVKDNQTLNLNTSASNTSYHSDNNTLYFSPVTTYDDGVYWCVAVMNLTAQWSHPYPLLVNYGPLSMSITGPGSAALHSSVSLTCSASSVPNCDFQWYFSDLSNSAVVSQTGPVFTFIATLKAEGNYTCAARNPVTNITMYRTKGFTVTGHAPALHMPTLGGLTSMLACALSLLMLFSC
ncbi:hemicentin-1-like [Betta splendens]|uniref:Hemicentin-1-like n=1 Tax=Betta splendens TaxID=158456 RepID=A0A9W2XBA9_BETSP|nr:hemicentin-1-like [Betta splendens]